MNVKNSIVVWLGPWLAAPVASTYLSMNSMMRHELWQYAVEFFVFVAMGAIQYKFARAKWLRSLLWPALIVLITALAANGPLDKVLWIVFYTIGIVLLIMHLMKDFQKRVQPRPAIAILVTVLTVVFARYLDLGTSTAWFSEATHDQTIGAISRLGDDIIPARNGLADRTADKAPIIIITVDTLRADFAQNMSSWQRMASRGAWWDSAMSTSSWTLPAAASLITGLAPSQHGAGCFADQCQGMSDNVQTIAQVLKDQGYYTVAVTANPWITESTGFGRGIDRYLDFSGITPVRLSIAHTPAGAHKQDAERLVDMSIDLINGLPDSGFFLWLHLIDPHMPYHHAEHPDMQKVRASTIRTSPPSSASARSLVVDGYRGEVRHADTHLNRFLDALENRGLLDTAIIVFTSDHGEEFWEHGDIEHGHSHHGEVIEVPLVIIGPDVDPSRRKDVASLVDIVPTIRATIGLEPDGIDLRNPVPGDRIARAFGNAHTQNARSARNTKIRVIVEGGADQEAPFIHAYDLLRDPAERMPWVPLPEDSVVQAALSVKAPVLGKKALVNTEELKALGYLE